ncbi:RNA methyltransferase [Candidatus Marsarchaeota archaeon]|nr:RNA methyltransferase [Candidatus Marsarchaeota archaeon]MCL5405021.1 RNA methyltransferase [Candidatus Marsarchaeota archaeon]
MRIRLVVVEPHYQLNIGYMARVAKNFGIERLWIVNPKCRYNGKTAIKYSKHAYGLIARARICKSLAEATKGTMSIGTTAIWRKASSGSSKVYELSDIAKLKGLGNKRVSLVIGRDTTGLTSAELSECDAIVFIGASPSYPTLNISHALAIMLYTLSGNLDAGFSTFAKASAADSGDIEMLYKLFSSFVDHNKKIRKKAAVKQAFKHMLQRSAPTKREVATLLIAFTKKT